MLKRRSNNEVNEDRSTRVYICISKEILPTSNKAIAKGSWWTENKRTIPL